MESLASNIHFTICIIEKFISIDSFVILEGWGVLKMKKCFLTVGIFIGTLLILVNFVFAVGVKFYTENATIIEGSETCLQYDIFNPSDRNIVVSIEVSGALKESGIESHSGFKTIEAKTMSDQAIGMSICFTKSECEGKVNTYPGDIYFMEYYIDPNNNITSSEGKITVYSPLNLTVICKPAQLDNASINNIVKNEEITPNGYCCKKFLWLCTKYCYR